MEWIQFVILEMTMIICFGFLYYDERKWRTKIKKENETKKARSDELYKEFCDLEKEIREIKIC